MFLDDEQEHQNTVDKMEDERMDIERKEEVMN
jgi:hypothetical protein